jgi:hypothetical protein
MRPSIINVRCGVRQQVRMPRMLGSIGFFIFCNGRHNVRCNGRILCARVTPTSSARTRSWYCVYNTEKNAVTYGRHFPTRYGAHCLQPHSMKSLFTGYVNVFAVRRMKDVPISHRPRCGLLQGVSQRPFALHTDVVFRCSFGSQPVRIVSHLMLLIHFSVKVK